MRCALINLSVPLTMLTIKQESVMVVVVEEEEEDYDA